MRSSLKKRRMKRNVLSVSLFPFLAVLICTLGVLIVMLVMAAKSADVDAVKRQTDDDETHLEKIRQLEEKADVQLATIEGLELVRPEALLRLEDSRSNRSHVKDEIRRLKEEYEQVGKELVELDRQSKWQPSEIKFSEVENENAIANLKKEIEQTRTDLAKKRKVVKKMGPAKYQILPHRGAGGTFRRPIFMECTSDAITLQPSGIKLLKSEFAAPLEPGNMIDSALITIREYWKRYDLAGKEGNPYPLIVIRPGGAQTFVLARRAMKSWDDEFGYELVEADTPLEFGKPDPQLKEEIQKVVEEARIRQLNRIARSAMVRTTSFGNGGRRRRGGRDYRGGLTASGPRGGFVASAGGFDDPESYGASEVAQASRMTGDSKLGSGFPQNNSFDSGQTQTGNQTGDNQFQPTGQQNRGLAQSPQSNDWNQNSSGERGNKNSQTGSQSSQSKAQGGTGGDSMLQNPYADQSLAQERGGNWALPTQTPGATGYLRPIRVVCHPNLIEVYSGGQSKKIPVAKETETAIDPLVDEIWNQIEAWGVPGPNGYWKPQLRIRIAPGGRERFLQLKGLLYRSGLAIQESR